MDKNITGKNITRWEKYDIDLGEVKLNEPVTHSIKCTQNPDLIDYVYAKCACSDPSILIDEEGNKELKVIYTAYDKGDISRYIYVKLDPEIPEYTKDENNKRITNPLLRIVRFHITGKCI
jgi:hypothetical protein